MPRPLDADGDEARVWSRESNPYKEPLKREQTQAVLAKQFPELVTAGGTVDPNEVLMALLDRVKELEARVDDAR